MSLLVVGSVALDSVETPFGAATRCWAARPRSSRPRPASSRRSRVVAVVGEDFPEEHLDFLALPGSRPGGAGAPARPHLPLEGALRVRPQRGPHARHPAQRLRRLRTRAAPRPTGDSDYVFLGNIDPDLQRHVLDQVRPPRFVGPTR